MTKEEEEKVVLRSGQTAEGSSSQQTEGESTQESAQTQQTVLDPERVSEARRALDPFYRRAEEEGAVRAFLDTYAKPDPADVERAERAARRRKQAAVLAESLRLISDMGTGFAGGNVYERGGAVARDVQAAEGEAQRAREKYDAELERFNAALLGARQGDMARRDALDRMALQYGTRTESTSTGKSKSSSSTHGSTESRGSGWQEQQARGTVSGRGSVGGGGKGKSDSGTISTVPVVDKDGKPAYRPLHVPSETEDEFYREASRIILSTDYLRKLAISKFSGKDKDGAAVTDALTNADLPTTSEGGRKAEEMRKTIVRTLVSSDPLLQSILKYYGGQIGYEEGDIPYQSTGIVGTEYDNYRVRMPGSGTQAQGASTNAGGTAVAQYEPPKVN